MDNILQPLLVVMTIVLPIWLVSSCLIYGLLGLQKWMRDRKPVPSAPDFSQDCTPPAERMSR